MPLFWGVYFPLYDETKHLLQTKHVFDQYHPGVVHCVSAICTGAVADLICNPLFVVRTRLQTQALHELTSSSSSAVANKKPATTSMRVMAKKLKDENGIRVFWRGMTANLIGLSHCAVQFPTYEYLKRYFCERRQQHDNLFSDNNAGIINSNDNDNTVSELLFSSGLAKMSASLLTYPHEVIRSRMIDDRSNKAPTFRDTIKKIYMKEGLNGYYNGLSVTLLRVVPNCCVTFLTYEIILRYSKSYFCNR